MNKPYRNLGEALTEIQQDYSLAIRSYNPDTFDNESFTEKRSIATIMETNWERCKEAIKRARKQFGAAINPAAFLDLEGIIPKLKDKLRRHYYQTQ